MRTVSRKINPHLLASLSLIFSYACKPNSRSEIDAIATANSFKTGFFIPSFADGLSSNISTRLLSGSEVDGWMRQQNVTKVVGASYNIVVTTGNEKVLLGKGANSEAVPMLSQDAQGKVYEWSTLAQFSNNEVLLPDLYIRHERGQEPKPFVSADGNSSNMYVVERPVLDIALPLPILVNWVDHIVLRDVLLFRYGSRIMHAATGKAVFEFVKAGHQVWQLKGVDPTGQLGSDAVLWSRDLQTYYSLAPEANEVIEWKKQDKDSMDVVKKHPSQQFSVPSLVKSILQEQIKKSKQTDGSWLQHPASAPSLVDRDARAIYLNLPANAPGASLALQDGSVKLSAEAIKAINEQLSDDEFYDDTAYKCALNPACKKTPGFALGQTLGQIQQGQAQGQKALKELQFASRSDPNSATWISSADRNMHYFGGPQMSGGDAFKMTHNGKTYLAVVAAAPYTYEDKFEYQTKTRAGGPGVPMVRQEADTRMNVVAQELDANGQPVPNAQPIYAVMSAGRKGVVTAEPLAEAQKKYPTIQAQAGGLAESYKEQAKVLSEKGERTMQRADEQYSNLGASVLTSQVTSEGSSLKNGVVSINKTVGDKVGGTVAKWVPGGAAVKGWANYLGSNLAVGATSSSMQAATNAVVQIPNAVTTGDTSKLPSTSTASNIAMTSAATSFIKPSSLFEDRSSPAAMLSSFARKAGSRAGAAVTSPAEGGVPAEEAYQNMAEDTAYMGAQTLLDLASVTGPVGFVVKEGVRVGIDAGRYINTAGAATQAYKDSNALLGQAASVYNNVVSQSPTLTNAAADNLNSRIAAMQATPGATGGSSSGSGEEKPIQSNEPVAAAGETTE